MLRGSADASVYVEYEVEAARGAAEAVTTVLEVLGSGLSHLTGTHCDDADSERLMCVQDRRVGVLIYEKSSRYDGVV